MAQLRLLGSLAAGLGRRARPTLAIRSLAAWLPTDETELARMSQQALIHELSQHHQQVSEEIVPWFLQNMPASYFRQTDERVRLDHLRAISSLYSRNGAASSADARISLSTDLPDGRREFTIVRPGAADNHSEEIITLLKRLPEADTTLSRVKLFASKDQRFTLYTFQFDMPGMVTPACSRSAAHIMDFAAKVQAGEVETLAVNAAFEPAAVETYIARSTPQYTNNATPQRVLKQKLLYDRVVDGEGAAVAISPFTGEVAEGETSKLYWVDCAMSHVIPMVLLRGALRLLSNNHLDLRRVHLDVVDDSVKTDFTKARGAEEEVGGVTMMRLLVAEKEEATEPITTSARGADLVRHLERMKWYDDRTLKLALDKHPWLGLDRAEIIVALLSLLHGPLHKHNPWAYIRSSLFTSIAEERKISIAAEIADFFLEKFHPDQGEALKADETAFAARADAIRKEIQTGVGSGDPAGGLMLEKMLDAVVASLRSNVYRRERFALSMRLHPEIMNGPDETREPPFGVFFVHGRRFNGFHVRFRDISRGGMRLVTPAGHEAFGFESSRQFDEAYNLAFAQQLKNKDIPEGGSKAVCLIDTHYGLSAPLKGVPRSHCLRKSVKAMTDGLLDLIVEPRPDEAPLVDYLGVPELLYLGPDEQVIPEDIVWIAQQAARRGYPCPNAFMSSKPGAGINHKEFGVTSEGVNVFLAEALRFSGLDPQQDRFTVSMTGGPDGDVAGNMLNIMHRDYGDKARVVGLADGSGCAEDPDGLDMAELLRLFTEALPIGDFDEARLGPQGRLLKADTEEGIRARNTMHFRVRAHAFVPAGGRPSTVNGNNYKDFIVTDPASRKAAGVCPLVVEGANLFFTPEARQRLFEEAGVVIVKDSSANKAGVICSSYEICSSMLLSSEEFMAQKPEIVADVVRNLRSIAGLEAKLLFREFRNYEGSLPHFSERISNAINRLTDCVRAALGDRAQLQRMHSPGEQAIPIPAEDELLPLFEAHLPAALVHLAFDRSLERVPEAYRLNAYASSLASRIVYREGIHFVEAQPEARLATVAIKYMRAQRELEALVAKTESGAATAEDAAEMAQLVRRSAVRSRIDV